MTSELHAEPVCLFEDEAGELLPFPITVYVYYLLETGSYGEDADGRRGVIRTEVSITGVQVAERDCSRLTVEQAEWAARQARAMFLDRHT